MIVGTIELKKFPCMIDNRNFVLIGLHPFIYPIGFEVGESMTDERGQELA